MLNFQKNITLEICVDSLESAIIAEKGGANRVELCSDLAEGGITPSYGLIKAVRDNLSIDLSVMIRPRGGDFCYSKEEFQVMKEDIILAKQLKADCLAFGILLPTGDVDISRSLELIDLAKPLQVTFHRAFDFARNPFKALEDIISIRANRILTSGQRATVDEGYTLIKDLIIKANKRISIMAGSGVNSQNKDRLVNLCGVRELHLTAKKCIDSSMKYRPDNMNLSTCYQDTGYNKIVADLETITKIR